jgi:glycosyltransferase involved in cell wall biosynthesis
MKKILIINTTYSQFGGEDSNILDEIKLLEKFYKVEYLEFKNSGHFSIFDIIAFFTNSNFKSNRLLKSKIKSFDPHVVYVHNTWFKANLGIFRLLEKSNVKVLVKIHNFRYYCTRYFSAAKHTSGNDNCYMCNFQKKGFIFNKYFEDSYLKSILIILYGKRYIKILKNNDIRLLVMTNFQKNMLKSLSFKSEKISKYLNPITDLENSSYKSASNYIVYAGRLTVEKGITELLQAWNNTEINELKLKIIGDGELYASLKTKYTQKNIEFLGELDHERTINLIKNSRGVLTATKMFEGQPRLLCEASMSRVPSIFPNFGGMSEFFPEHYPLKFEQFNYKDLSLKIKLLQDSKYTEELSNDVFKFSSKIFDENKCYESFEKIISD